jgi:hypothetical protein
MAFSQIIFDLDGMRCMIDQGAGHVAGMAQ